MCTAGKNICKGGAKGKETGEEKTILFGLTGTGYFDMMTYAKFNDGVMTDYIPTDDELESAFEKFPTQPVLD